MENVSSLSGAYRFVKQPIRIIGPSIPRFGATAIEKKQNELMGSTPNARNKHLAASLKNFLLIPVVPLVGYFALDNTGITEFISKDSPMLQSILGEGFGHIGACYSLHHVFKTFAHLGKAFKEAFGRI